MSLDYSINDNGVFDKAASFISRGDMYPTTFLIHKPDFNSIEELEAYLEKYNMMN